MVTSMHVGSIESLWRYPVKSVRGEQVSTLTVEERGVVGDRLYAVRNLEGKLGSGKSSRRFRKMEGLLELQAVYDGATPRISFPDGRVLSGDDPAIHADLSTYVGQPVTLAR